MRYARPAFALLGFAAIMAAADPFAGTWKMNAQKSKYRTGAPPKEQTVTIAEADGNLDVTVTGTAADGTAISSHYTVPAQGGEGKIIESPYEAVSGKRMGQRQREISYSKGGKVVLTIRTRVSADDKTMTGTAKGTDFAGKPVDATVLYEKQ